MRRLALISLLSPLWLSACAQTAPPAALAAPTPVVAPATAPRGFVAAANPLAVEAGLRVLREGGSAADAAVAIQAVLSLVEPQSSGLGGGAFMTYYDARTGKVTAYDGREKAPGGAGPDMFLGPDGKPLPFVTALLSGRSTGVPGAVAMLAQVQKEHGRAAWNTLFRDAETLASDGFVVSPRLAGMINSPRVPQNSAADVKAYFTKPDGTLYQAGDTLRNPAYAATLKRLAAEGPSALYEGPIAQAIVDKVHEGALPGTISLSDMKAYRPRSGAALCRPWKVYTVCVPNPSSSGLAVIQALMMLEHTDIGSRGPTDPVAWTLMAEAERVMYADRDRYVGDPAFVKVPVDGLLDPVYVAERARLIGQVAGPAPAFGYPKGAPRTGVDVTHEPGGTTHFVVVDPDGNVVSMTTTVESIFGSGRMVGGFFLNNQLTDFSFAPVEKDGAPAANAVAAGKRPRSSMAPIIVLDNRGKFLAAVGSPGGNAILSYNLKAMVGVFYWGLSMQEAINLPNLVSRGSNFSGDADRFGPDLVAALNARGVLVKTGQYETSGLHGVIVRPGGVLEGGADPRREGVAKGL
ncbi:MULTISPECIES: gamma-glutamyltransferase [unclassified Caulobacter]|uniref:gamma-glutamyltransferase n=1 Tax=unclassified Caulobacter TaxID=2648921 RepID=UPI000D369E09|nr:MULTISPECIES: gamma-glutamyltransferase [unclassified Caulobacter]PTS86594.1 gamma-glutamyltransferase [Caulobacter sp. HMWF009]PTT13053.1 gamma-glutamyltransferase [Caulobacter sp. HMWF025]